MTPGSSMALAVSGGERRRRVRTRLRAKIEGGHNDTAGTTGAVAERVARTLSQFPELGGCEILWRFRDGVLELRGHASTYYQKQIAQVAAAAAAGVDRICNEIEVVGRAPRRDGFPEALD